MLTDLAINLLAGIIWDGCKWLCVSVKSRKPFEKDIKIFIQNNISNDLSLWVSEEDVLWYFSQPQVKDLLKDYANYVTTGTFSDGLSKISDAKRDSHTIDTTHIAKYLSHNYIMIKTESIKTHSQVELEKVFKEVLSLISKFYSDILLINERVQVAEITKRIYHEHNFFLDRLNVIEDKLDVSMKKPVRNIEDEYESIMRKYDGKLREKYKIAHIYMLDYFDFDKFYIPPTFDPPFFKDNLMVNLYGREIISRHHLSEPYRFSYSKRDQWKYIFNNESIRYVVGGAGFGKSLFMQQLIIKTRELILQDSGEYLVVFGDIKKLLNPNGTRKSMVEFLQDSMKNATLMDESSISIDFIKYYLDRGRCIVLLDALDEVPREERDDIHNSIISFFRNENPNNKVCITSRDRGFIAMHKDVEVLQIEPLTAQHIVEYVDKIIALGKFSKSDKDVFLAQAQVLIEKKFLSSFLVLSLLISIFKGERELPSNKLDLYHKCFEYIAHKREKDKSTQSFNWDKIHPLMTDNTFIELSTLCMPNNSEVEKKDIVDKLYYKPRYQCEADGVNAIEEFLRFCSERTELFVPGHSEGTFKFFHRSFFEYFYSQYIFFNFNDVNEIYEKLCQFDVDSEVFELVISSYKQKRQELYSKLIDFVFEKAQNELTEKEYSFSAFNILLLFLQVVDEEFHINAFIDLLCDFKSTVLDRENIERNSEIIVSVLINSGANIDRIFACYNKEIMRDIIFILVDFIGKIPQNRIIELLSSFEEKDEDEKNELKFLVPSDIYYARVGFSNFYTTLYIKNKDAIKDTSTLLQSPDFNSILTEVCPQKKKRNKLDRQINMFKSLDQSTQEKTLKFLFGRIPERNRKIEYFIDNEVL